MKKAVRLLAAEHANQILATLQTLAEQFELTLAKQDCGEDWTRYYFTLKTKETK